MPRLIQYGIFFIVILLLQVFLFNNINLSIYIYPLVYLGFIILLPMETPHIVTLLLGLVLGIATDLMLATAAVNTAATLLTAYLRPFVMNLILGKETVKDGGIPTVAKLGAGRFFKYTSVLVLIQCSMFFCLEALTWKYFYLTAIKIVCSGLITVILIYFSQMLLAGAGEKKTGS